MRSEVQLFLGPPLTCLIRIAAMRLAWIALRAAWCALSRRSSASSDSTRDPIGALAQLGEHLLCKQRVSGSIPLRSTIIGGLPGFCGEWRKCQSYRDTSRDVCNRKGRLIRLAVSSSARHSSARNCQRIRGEPVIKGQSARNQHV